MKNGTLIVAAGALAYVAWELSKEDGGAVGAVGDAIGDVGQSAATLADSVTGGILKISNMAKVTEWHVKHPNVQALLRVIRAGEGTADANGYRRIFGGQLFDSYTDHPRIVVKKSGYNSSAAGAYQILTSTWDETRRVMGLKDFSPRSQDWAAVGRIAARGALEDVVIGNFDRAVKKIAKEWASLPGSPYGQPTISWDKARNIYAQAGGNNNALA